MVDHVVKSLSFNSLLRCGVVGQHIQREVRQALDMPVQDLPRRLYIPHIVGLDGPLDDIGAPPEGVGDVLYTVGQPGDGFTDGGQPERG